VSVKISESWLFFRSEIVFRRPLSDRTPRVSMKNFRIALSRVTRFSAAAFLRFSRSIPASACAASNSWDGIYLATLSTVCPKHFTVVQQGLLEFLWYFTIIGVCGFDRRIHQEAQASSRSKTDISRESTSASVSSACDLGVI
jgi:hypothetical protein